MRHTVLAAIIAGVLLSSLVFGEYSGGTGSPGDPYLISTAEDMNQIGRNYADWDKCFKLTADINLSAYTGTQFNRIGTDAKHAFSGVFDGDRHAISNFTYTAENSDYIGVFSNVSATGKVENVFLVDVNVTGNYNIGGLVGYNEGTISNSSVAGTISGRQCVGGIVGYNVGSISGCNSTAAVAGGDYDYLGGLVGYNYRGSISDCHSAATVTGVDYSYCVGGLVGENSWGTITECYARGTVSGSDYSHYLGGLIGSNNSGTISNCYSTGFVEGSSYSQYVGGLLGRNSYGTISYCYSTGVVTGGYNSDYLGGLVGENSYSSVVTDCYAATEVGGDYDVGGLVGMNDNGTITRCYSSGSVSGYMFVGGLLGWNYEGTATNSFWDIETSGQSWSAGGEPKTTVEMKMLSTFTDAGWDFSTTDGDPADWQMPLIDYPRLAWEDIYGGSGTPEDPYQIASKSQLLRLAADTDNYNKCFILTADINLQGRTFTTAIIAPDTSSSSGYQGTAFTGTFDGNGHKITHLTINGGSNDYLGLFGAIEQGAQIKNITIENVNIEAGVDSTCIGGLAGINGLYTVPE